MSFEPRTQGTIYTSVRDRIKTKIPDLTNFTETSFNWVWTQAFSSEIREKELDTTAAYLAGLVEYAGGPITQEDLEELGIEDVTDPDELNDRLDDNDLDELVKIVGTTRDPGSKAAGTVTFTTQTAQTDIPKGTSVGVQPEEDGSFFEFTTDSQVSTADGVTSVDADITAVEVGTDHNVGSGTISYLPSPPSGVQSVTNSSATTGGEDVESNDELRERAKNAIFENSGGGTVEGIKGYIRNNVDNVDEVEVVEFFTGDTWHGSYPHSHVIVSGGTESDVLDAIDASRPVAVQHVLVRPETLSVRVDADLEGQDIDTSRVEDRIKDYIGGLGLNSKIVNNQIIQTVMNADSNIVDVESLTLYIENETTPFDNAQDVYVLSQGDEMADDGITEVTGTLNSSSHTFVEDNDYQEWDSTNGNNSPPHDAIDWSLGGDDPDVTTGNSKTLTYSSGTTEYFVDEAMITDGITQVDGTLNGSSHTFTEGTDYEEVDTRSDGIVNGIDWSIGGDNPDDDTDFTVTYDAGTDFDTTYEITQGKDINFDKTEQPTPGTINITVL